MKYFFQLGSNRTLSIAEIFAVFQDKKIRMRLLNANILLLETDEKINTPQLIKKLGGSIKIGIIKNEIKSKRHLDEIIKKIIALIPKQNEKIKFGISYYGKINIDPKKLGMSLKKRLKENKINSRWVQSKEKILSSVVVEQNKLIEKGIEINLISDKENIFLAQTTAVQPFKELSFRDYGRPARDDKSGMIPPKLAMIMLNLSGIKKTDIILDPFCGSGTIINEAIYQNYQHLIGSDKSDKAVLDTKRNMEWIKRKQNSKIQALIIKADVLKISQQKQIKKIDKIITEPYLGPQRGIRNFYQIKKDLDIFYTKVIYEFSKILNKNGRVVMVWPIFLNKNKKLFLDPNLNGFKISNPISKNFLEENNVHLSFRNTFLYGREGQKVWREIVILEK